jgi:hypothetical protein
MRARCDDEEPLTFGEQLVLAVAPAAVAALIEHIAAPLVGLAFQKPAEKPKRSRKRSAAAARGFAAFVRFERAR